MKKLLFTLVIVLIAATAFAQTDRGQSKQVIAAIFTKQYADCFLPKDIVAAKNAVNDFLIRNTSYTSINPDFVEEILKNSFDQNTDFIYDPESRIKLGKLVGATHLVIFVASFNSTNSYSIHATLVDATTGIQMDAGKASFAIRYKELQHLYATMASSFLAANPIEFQKHIKSEIKQGERRIDKRPETEPGPFGVKNLNHKFGIELNYVSRSYAQKSTSTWQTIEGINPWGGSNINGVQAGVRFDAYFAPKYVGIGLSTGIYGGYYFFDGNKRLVGEDADVAFKEATLTIPVQLIYRVDFSHKIGIYVRGGISADFMLYSQLSETQDGTTESYRKLYDNPDWNYSRMFNYSLVYGAGIQIGRLILEVSRSHGLYDLSKTTDFKVLQNKNIQVGVTFMF